MYSTLAADEEELDDGNEGRNLKDIEMLDV